MHEEITYRLMKVEDVDQIIEVERASFATPWIKDAFINEITNNHFAYYIVAVHQERLIGYSGVWVIVDEAHITNIAVHPEYRGKQIGEKLLRRIIYLAMVYGAIKMTLEVRVSNHVAQALYEKLGFERKGLRKGYYTDNQEDAIIMWVNLDETKGISEDFRNRD